MSEDDSRPAYSRSLFNFYTIAFEGITVSCILYGVHLVIARTNLYLLHKKQSNRRSILSWFTVIQLALASLYFAFSLYAEPGRTLAIFNIGSSYGPDTLSPWFMVIVDTTFVLNTWASDGFLVYRCYVICMGNMYLFAVPMLLYLVAFGASIALLVVSSIPGAMFSTHVVQLTGTFHWSCSAALNVCASTLISTRLWLHCRAMHAIDPESEGDSFYLGYISMTLESALLYTMFVIVALVVFVLDSPLETIFFPVLSAIQVIAPSLIIYRIARGISLETELETGALDSLRFSVSACTQPRSAVRSVHLNTDQINDPNGTPCASSSEFVSLDGFAQRPVKTDSAV